MNEEEEKKEEMIEMMGLASKMLQSRTLVISQAVSSKLTDKILNQLILLEQESAEEGITIMINSPGGEVFSGLAIFDTLKFITCPITTVVTGFAASMGSILSLAGDTGRCFAMPNSKIMIHQPLLTGYRGSAIDLEIQREEILKTRDMIIQMYCEKTGKTYEEIKKALDRDNWMTAPAAVEYGLIDKIVHTRADLA